MKREGGLGVTDGVLPCHNSHHTGQIQEVKGDGRGDEEEEQEEVWGVGGGLLQLFGFQALVGLMEQLSRASGGP